MKFGEKVSKRGKPSNLRHFFLQHIFPRYYLAGYLNFKLTSRKQDVLVVKVREGGAGEGQEWEKRGGVETSSVYRLPSFLIYSQIQTPFFFNTTLYTRRYTTFYTRRLDNTTLYTWRLYNTSLYTRRLNTTALYTRRYTTLYSRRLDKTNLFTWKLDNI